MDDLAGSLRTWRDRLDPAAAGLPAGARRRAPGLRREEVAQLAGLSVDYLARLEQGRADAPSPSVLTPLARALRLTNDERDHLFRLAGHLPPGSGVIDHHITPAVQRLLDRFSCYPVVVSDPAWWIVAMNPLGAALVGDHSHLTGNERNVIWRTLVTGESRTTRTPEEIAHFVDDVVSDLRDALGRFPADDRLRQLIDDLRDASPLFAGVWERGAVRPRVSDRKTLDHPELGPITIDCDVLTVRGSDLRVVVYTAPPGTPDADALAMLGAIGLQSFSA